MILNYYCILAVFHLEIPTDISTSYVRKKKRRKISVPYQNHEHQKIIIEAVRSRVNLIPLI